MSASHFTPWKHEFAGSMWLWVKANGMPPCDFRTNFCGDRFGCSLGANRFGFGRVAMWRSRFGLPVFDPSSSVRLGSEAPSAGFVLLRAVCCGWCVPAGILKAHGSDTYKHHPNMTNTKGQNNYLSSSPLLIFLSIKLNRHSQNKLLGSAVAFGPWPARPNAELSQLPLGITFFQGNEV